MARVTFTPNIQRHVVCPAARVTGDNVREVLDCVFTDNPVARSYVLDDQGALRQHMVVFINGNPVLDRVMLSDAVPSNAEVFVMQALSGG